MIPDKVVLSENQTSLKPGRIKFYNQYKPALPAGKYRASLLQEIEADGLERQAYTRRQDFEVAGPRFTLPQGEIHSVYPPANGEEDYNGHMPQITFRKRTLPWERAIDSTAEKQEGFEVPWMALLVFEEEELILNKKDRKKATRTRAVSRDTSSLIHPNTQTHLAPIGLSPGLGDEPSCYTIDLKVKDFLSIAPKSRDLAYLAHVREVNTDDKEFLGMHADGWFSVVLANRLPKTPPPIGEDPLEEAKGVKFARNIVHLVSLEGFMPYLEDELTKQAAGEIAARQYVRLASLASWEFYCKPPEESFSMIMKNLDTGLLRIDASFDESQSAHHAYLNTALEGGYIPLQYNMREGEKAMAWYRGPLIPVINDYEPKTEDEDVFFSAEAGMIYDDEQGLFDLSQAVAWQIGRLLALNDAHFSQHLLDWKKVVNRKIDELLKRQEIAARPEVKTTLDTDAGTLDLKHIRELMQEDFAANLFSDNFLERLAVAREFLEQQQKPSLMELELAEFPGVLPDREAYRQIIESGRDPEEGLVDVVRGLS